MLMAQRLRMLAVHNKTSNDIQNSHSTQPKGHDPGKHGTVRESFCKNRNNQERSFLISLTDRENKNSRRHNKNATAKIGHSQTSYEEICDGSQSSGGDDRQNHQSVADNCYND